MKKMRIVSGGQTGVDRAALDAALATGFPCGGWCPRARRAEDGRIADHYPVEELASAGYRPRTRANVRDSQATLILVATSVSALSGGTRLTASEARRLGRPLLVVDMPGPAGRHIRITEILAWIGANDITVLNVAGPRESTSPGIYDAAYGLLTDLLSALIPSRS